MTDLAEFLLARISEDEMAATLVDTAGAAPTWKLTTWPHDGDGVPFAAAARTFNPARVLAECAAKRRIVTWHTDRDECCEVRLGPMIFDAESTVSVSTDSWGGLVTRRSIGHQERLGCVTLMLLALPYADHPDWREEWRV